jgi:hypothetical protein
VATNRTHPTSEPANSNSNRTRGIIYFSVPSSASHLQQLAGPKSDEKQDDKAAPGRQITAISLSRNVLVASSQADVTPFTPRVTSYPSAVNDCCKARAGQLPITRGLSYRRVACRLVWRKLPRRFFVIPACVTGQCDPICFAGRTGRTEAGKRKMTNSRFCCLECLPRSGAWCRISLGHRQNAQLARRKQLRHQLQNWAARTPIQPLFHHVYTNPFRFGSSDEEFCLRGTVQDGWGLDNPISWAKKRLWLLHLVRKARVRYPDRHNRPAN